MNDSPTTAVLNMIRNSVNGMQSSDIRQKATLLDGKQVSNALFRLKNDGLIEIIDHGRSRVYVAVAAEPAAAEPAAAEPAAAEPAAAEPAAAEQHPALIQIDMLDVRLKSAGRGPVDNLSVKRAVLMKLSAILHPDIGDVLESIAADIQ